MGKAAHSQLAVRALKPGFDGNQVRKAGDVFSIPNEEAFSDRWMEKVPAKDVKASAEARAEFEEKFAEDKTLGPDVRRSALDKAETSGDFAIDSSDKPLAERQREAAVKAREKDEAEAKKAEAAKAAESKGKK